jgi:hypothetical protein
MGTIIAQFSDGRLFVNEERAVDQKYGKATVGVPFRIGGVRTVEKIVSLEAYLSGYYNSASGSLVASHLEATISGDTLMVILRRGDDLYMRVSGALGRAVLSGESNINLFLTPGYLAGITSGIPLLGELASGAGGISGIVNINANVIAH